MPPPSSFSLLQDKSLSSPVLLAAWCPCMDLLATVSQDNQLTIRRLDWQTLWVACPNASITALSWKPDGKEVVTGHSDGSIRHFSVELREISHEAASPSGPHAGSPIVHLSWAATDAHVPSMPMLQHLKLRHFRFFNRPPLATDPAPKPPTAADLDLAPSAQSTPWPTPTEALHILVSCDARGVMCLSAYGRLQLARVDLRDACGLQNIEALQVQVHVTPDLSNIVALVQPDLEPQPYSQDAGTVPAGAPREDPPVGGGVAMPGRGAPEGRTVASVGEEGGGCIGGGGVAAAAVLQAVAYRSDVLQHPHIQQLAVLAVHLHAMVAAALHGVASAHKEWQSAQMDLRKRLGQLAQSLRDNAESDPSQGPGWQEDEELVEGEIMCLLASGVASPGMNAFLTGTLGEHGLRRLAKAMDSAVQSVHALLLDQVQPAVEVAAFLLGEIKGLALAGCGSLGLQAEQVSQAELEACKAVLQCEALRLAVTAVGCKLRTLFNWLHRTWYQLEGLGKEPGGTDNPEARSAPGCPLTGPHIQDILALLSGHLAKDSVAPDLQDAPVYLSPGDEDQVASLAFARSPLVDEARKAMELMYRPLLPPDLSPNASTVPPPCTTSAPGHAGALPSPPPPPVWPSKPLNAQLKSMSAFCESVLASVSVALSPALEPVLQVPVAPLQPSTGALVCTFHTPSAKDECVNDSIRVCVAIPSPTNPEDTPPAFRGLLNPGGELLLVAELAGAVQEHTYAHSVACASGGLASGVQRKGATVQASILQVPPGLIVQDLAPYRNGQLGLLLAPGTAGGKAAAVPEGGRLALLPLDTLQLVACMGAAGAGGSVLEACLRHHTCWPQLDVSALRLRACPQAGYYEPPLALSGPRGVAALFSDAARAHLLDVEEDEEDDDEEGEDGEEEENGDDGDAMDA